VAVTNYAAVSNGYLVQLPTIGTNTANTAWWYTAYFRRSGSLYWTGNGRLNILATTSTADGLNWQEIVSGSGADSIARAVASNAQAVAAAALPKTSTNGWEVGSHSGLLTPAWATTGTVSRSNVLSQPDGSAAVLLRTGTAIVERVTYDLTRLIVVSSDEAFDAEGWQAPVGTVFVLTNTWNALLPNYAPYYESENGAYAISGNVGLDSYWRWTETDIQPGWGGGLHTWKLGNLYTPGEVYSTISTGEHPYIVIPVRVTNSVDLATSDQINAFATTNWVESIRGIHVDIATNVVWHLVVSNGHWLVREVQ
jgi:hypothetical protein